ncbi:hypothetical protein XA68_15172 [Ophiocordyceps unilateralis]|uniref:Rhomboid family membrane protein n=1 Tax=Ophiocordyceps unilateralis TaxID=268505 RepID=A0A2A9PM05_OPHUN|nr:hypothetical protein XA68_15172 [Ophiocordyceps unilateralis]
MDHPQPTLPPRHAFLHKAAVAGAIMAPLAMLLPPRRVDIRFVVLFGTFSLATNHLAYEYTGETLLGRFGRRFASVGDLPDGAKRTQQALKKQRDDDDDDEEEEAKGGFLRDLWMGGEDRDWKKKRAEEHRRSLEEGKGLADIILQQVADVWHGTWRPDSKEKPATGSEANNERGK